MSCPKCGSKQYFTCTESTKCKEVWKECFSCGYKKTNKVISEKEFEKGKTNKKTTVFKKNNGFITEKREK